MPVRADMAKDPGPRLLEVRQALEAVTALVRLARERAVGPREPDARQAVEAVRSLAAAVQKHRPVEIDRLRKEVQDRFVKPIDPFELPTNPLRAVRVADDEPSWTRWLATCVDPRLAGAAARVLFRALASEAALSAEERDRSPTDVPNVRLLTAEGWRTLAMQAPVCASIEVLGHGQEAVDLLVQCEDTIVLIENKLFSDLSTDDQLERYAEHIAAPRAGNRRAGLILLTARDHPRVARGWDKVSYRDLALSLRRLERDGEWPAPACLWPRWLIVETLAAIEGDILGVRMPDPEADPVTQLECLRSVHDLVTGG